MKFQKAFKHIQCLFSFCIVLYSEIIAQLNKKAYIFKNALTSSK